jgi:hypothetical protein
MCDVAAELIRLRSTITREVFEALKKVDVTTNYTTVWREYEDAAIAQLIRVLQANIGTLQDENFETGERGSEKNRLADLAISCAEGMTAVSIKAARASKSPQNDLGTFRAYANKKRIFNRTFELWVRYDDAGEKIRIDQVFFDDSYKFVGIYKSTGGVAYRKKDGNLRPKPWAMFDNDTSFWNTPAEFARAFEVSRVYRANSLVQEYLVDLTDDDMRLLYETLRQRFEGQVVRVAQPDTALLPTDETDI